MSFLKMEFAKTPSGHPFNFPMPSEHKITLYPILTAATLLAHPKRRLLLEKIKKHCGLELRYYQMCYEPLVNQFVELVQALPFQAGGGPGSLMDYGLERAEIILQAYKQESNDRFDPMHAYAIFIAGLAQDLGRISRNQKVILSDKVGNFIAHWTPYEGSMVGKGEFYKLRFYENQWVSLGREVTTLLARQIIPAIGFIWLAQDNRLLQMLLATLSDDAAVGGDIYHWLQLANKRFQIRPPKDHLPPLALNVKTPKETEMGEAFLFWLNRGLRDGTILVDKPDACVYRLRSGGIFLERRIFTVFCDGYSAERLDWMIPCQQFIALGLTTTEVGTLRFVQFYIRFTKKTQEPVTPGSYHFLDQNKQRSAFKVAAKPKASQPMIREGLVIPPENAHLVYEFVASMEPAELELQPVEPVASSQLSAEKKLASLLEQQMSAKQPAQGRM